MGLRGWPSQFKILKLLQREVQVHGSSMSSSFAQELCEAERELNAENADNVKKVVKVITKCEPAEFVRYFPGCFGDEDRLCVFIHHYYSKCKYILSKRREIPVAP